MSKIVIAVVPGWAVGGGHSLHVVCDLTVACAEHGLFKQTDPDVASFDGGFGSAYLARMVGQKRAREVFFLGRQYSSDEAAAMGMVNASVPHAELEAVALEWAAEIGAKSPTAQMMLKYAFNLIDDGLVGQQIFAGEATRLAYGTAEAAEGRNAFLEKRRPDFEQFSLAVLNPAPISRPWLAAARPRTWPAALVPTLVAAGSAFADGVFDSWPLLLTVVGALAVQIAANFANDVSDAARGADTEDRVGPQRMVASGSISSRAMWRACVLALLVAAASAGFLTARVGPVIVWIAIASVLALFGYVGGPWPYGYRGLGEVFVFVFFGLIATVGSRLAYDGHAPRYRVDAGRADRTPGRGHPGGQQPARSGDRSKSGKTDSGGADR